MKLIKLSVTNVKGQTFTEDVADLTLYVGANFKGKTARMIARTLVLLGYLPELGKTHKATFTLSSGSAMKVSGLFDNGMIIQRSWTLKGNSVVYEEIVPDAIKSAGDLAVMMDASLYFGLSDQKRVEYVFGMVDVGGVWTNKGILQRIAEKVPESVLATENKPNVIARILAATPAIESTSVQQFVDICLVQMADEYKSASAHVKRCEATVQQLTAARANDKFEGPALALLEQMRAATNAEIATLNEKKGGLIQSFAKMKSDRSRREVIEREIRFADKNRFALADWTEKLRLLNEAYDAATPVTRDDLRAPNEKGVEIKVKIASTSEKSMNASKQKKKAESDLAALDTATECPYCGAQGEGWKKIRLAELVQIIDASETAHTEAQKEMVDLTAQLEAAREEYKAIDARLKTRDELTAKINEAKHEISDLQANLARVTTLTEELSRLTPDDPALDAKVQTLQSELNVKAEELRGIEAGIKAYQGREQERKRMADAEAERDAALKEKETAKAVGLELKAIQGEMVESVFAPLLAKANAFFSAVLRAPLAYNVDGGEIGFWNGGVWVGHHTFSGTEKALTYAAIQMALASSSPCKLMQFDEFRRLDDANQMAVLALIEQAVISGSLDQAVCALPSSNKNDFVPGRFAPFKTVVIG